jgi:hypothetical protein
MIREVMAGLGATLLPLLSFGLGLGDIQVESQLNQPLYARVEVVNVSDDDWRQIRARIAPRTLLSEGALHPEVLASLTLRTIDDSKGRHFIEVKSGEVLTEPLFDLPVEVAGQSLQVVRNYSVLLDPATSEDAPREVPAALVAEATGEGGPVADAGGVREGGGARGAGRLAARARYDAVAKVDAQSRVSRRPRARGARNHSTASRKLAKAANTAGPANSTSVPGALDSGNAANTTAAAPLQVAVTPTATGTSGQEQLEGQLATLQQTLTRMQATIASQNVEIAKLTAQVGLRGASPASRRPSTWVEYPARKDQTPSDEASDDRSGWFSAWSATFFWIGGALVGIAALAFGVVSFRRWRHAKMLREIALHEAARRQPASKPAVAPTSERDLLAWQSSLRAVDSESAAASAAPASANEDTVAVTVAIEELTQDFEADLETLNASYEAERRENTSDAMAAWRTQNEMLERDYFSDTAALPHVVESGNQVKTIDDEERNLPAAGRSAAVVREARHDTDDSDFVVDVAV